MVSTEKQQSLSSQTGNLIYIRNTFWIDSDFVHSCILFSINVLYFYFIDKRGLYCCSPYAQAVAEFAVGARACHNGMYCTTVCMHFELNFTSYLSQL